MARTIRASGMKAAKVPNNWFEYRLQIDPRFLCRIDRARSSLQAGHGISLEDVETEEQESHRSDGVRGDRT